MTEHSHHWTAEYDQDGNFTGVRCACGLFMAPIDLEELLNRRANDLLIEYIATRAQKVGPSEYK